MARRSSRTHVVQGGSATLRRILMSCWALITGFATTFLMLSAIRVFFILRVLGACEGKKALMTCHFPSQQSQGLCFYLASWLLRSLVVQVQLHAYDSSIPDHSLPHARNPPSFARRSFNGLCYPRVSLCLWYYARLVARRISARREYQGIIASLLMFEICLASHQM